MISASTSGWRSWSLLTGLTGLVVALASTPVSCQTRTARLVDSITPYVGRRAQADSFSGTVLVAHRGKVIFVQSYGEAGKDFGAPNNKDTKFDLASMTKMFTGVAIMQLAQAGRLSLDDSLGRYLTGFRPEVSSRVRIRHLLTHTSGLGEAYWRPEFHDANHARFRRVADFVPLFVRDSLAFEPGSRWSYSNAGFVTLGAIIERVTGTSYYEYVRDHVFRPAGMRNTEYFELDRVVPNRAIGYTRRNRYILDQSGWSANTFVTTVKGSPAGGAYSTAPDLLAFATALVERRLLDSSWTAEALTGKVPYDNPERKKKYGYGIAEQVVNGARILFHDGGSPGISTQLDIYPDLGYVVIVLSNYDPPAGTTVANQIRQWVTTMSDPTRARSESGSDARY